MEKTIIIPIVISILTVAYGLYLEYSHMDRQKKIRKKALKISISAFVPALLFVILVGFPQFAEAQGVGESASGLGFIAAGLSTGLACLGAGVAVANVGSSAIGAVSEDPKILGKSMIFLGLAEGIAIYGLIISIMILGRL